MLDFVNKHDDIFSAFKPYYDTTTLSEKADPALLEELKFKLDSLQVYYWSEIEAFAQIFYKAVDKQSQEDHARLNNHIQPAKDRYKALDRDKQKLFKDKISAYIKLYAFISQILPFSDSEHEKFYSYGRYLNPNLPTDKDSEIIKPEDEISLQYYRIEHAMSDSIVMEEGEPYGIKSPTEVGTGKSKDEKKPLSEIIEVLNDRFETDFTEEDRLFFEQIKEKALNDEAVIQTANANPLDKFELGIKKMIENLMIQRMSDNDDIVSRYMDDIEFQEAVFPILTKEIYEKIAEEKTD